jgi:hypothetical protein
MASRWRPSARTVGGHSRQNGGPQRNGAGTTVRAVACAHRGIAAGWAPVGGGGRLRSDATADQSDSPPLICFLLVKASLTAAVGGPRILAAERLVENLARPPQT